MVALAMKRKHPQHEAMASEVVIAIPLDKGGGAGRNGGDDRHPAVQCRLNASLVDDSSATSSQSSTKSSSRFRPSTAAVSFSPNVQVLPIPNRQSFTEEERKSLWLSTSEYRKIKKEAEHIIRLWSSSPPSSWKQTEPKKKTTPPDDGVEDTSSSRPDRSERFFQTWLKGHGRRHHAKKKNEVKSSWSNCRHSKQHKDPPCFLGLEAYTTHKRMERRDVRERAIFAVLREQDLQYQEGYKNCDWIASAYKEHTVESCHRALVRGKVMAQGINELWAS